MSSSSTARCCSASSSMTSRAWVVEVGVVVVLVGVVVVLVGVVLVELDDELLLEEELELLDEDELELLEVLDVDGTVVAIDGVPPEILPGGGSGTIGWPWRAPCMKAVQIERGPYRR